MTKHKLIKLPDATIVVSDIKILKIISQKHQDFKYSNKVNSKQHFKKK